MEFFSYYNFIYVFQESLRLSGTKANLFDLRNTFSHMQFKVVRTSCLIFEGAAGADFRFCTWPAEWQKDKYELPKAEVTWISHL